MFSLTLTDARIGRQSLLIVRLLMQLQEVWKVSEAGSINRGQSDVANWVTLYGFTGDSGMSTVAQTIPSRRFLFLGDSWTFGAGTMVGRIPIGSDSDYVCTTVPDYYPSGSNYWSWGAILCRYVTLPAVSATMTRVATALNAMETLSVRSLKQSVRSDTAGGRAGLDSTVMAWIFFSSCL